MAEYISDASKMGVSTKGPCVNSSDADFTSKDKVIYFGLSGVKNIGIGFAKSIVEERNSSGSFKSFYDFVSRMSKGSINKTQLYSLICAGAFDSLGEYRSRLLKIYEELLVKLADKKRRESDGQLGLFDDFDDNSVQDIQLPDTSGIPELSLEKKLTLEKEMTGLYFSGHPLDNYLNDIKASGALGASALIKQVQDVEEGISDKQRVKLYGLIRTLTKRKTSSGNMMAIAQLEDESAECEIIFFNNKLTEYEGILAQGIPVVIQGYVSLKDEMDFSVVVNSLSLLKDNSKVAPSVPKVSVEPEREKDKKIPPKRIYVKVDSLSCRQFERVRAICEIFKGNVPLIVYDLENKKYHDMGLMITNSEFVVNKLKSILTEDSVVIK